MLKLKYILKALQFYSFFHVLCIWCDIIHIFILYNPLLFFVDVIDFTTFVLTSILALSVIHLLPLLYVYFYLWFFSFIIYLLLVMTFSFYLKIFLVYDLYSENHRTLMRDIEDDTKKWKYILCSKKSFFHLSLSTLFLVP